MAGIAAACESKLRSQCTTRFEQAWHAWKVDSDSIVALRSAASAQVLVAAVETG
jgi:hypothetical protein